LQRGAAVRDKTLDVKHDLPSSTRHGAKVLSMTHTTEAPTERESHFSSPSGRRLG
jgi:hypothetical protein